MSYVCAYALSFCVSRDPQVRRRITALIEPLDSSHGEEVELLRHNGMTWEYVWRPGDPSPSGAGKWKRANTPFWQEHGKQGLIPTEDGQRLTIR